MNARAKNIRADGAGVNIMAFTVSSMANQSIMNAIFSLSQSQSKTGTSSSLTSLLSGGGLSKTSGLGALASAASLASTQQTAQTALANQQSFNRSELALRTSAKALNSADAASVFGAATAKSTNAAAVSATVSASPVAGDYKVNVTQVAKEQKVSGTNVTAAAPTAISAGAAGYGQMQVNIGGKLELVTFALSGAETNQQAIQKIANSLNTRSIGVVATVTTDSSGNAKLDVKGATGAAKSFTIQDVVGNAAAVTGVSSPAAVTQTAQDAKVNVNGTNYTSASNDIAVGTTGVTINVKQPTAGTETVTVSAGNSAQTEQSVRDYVAQYNDTMSKLKTNPASYARTSAMNLQVQTAMSSKGLRDIGITAGTNGQLSINETTFKQAVATNPTAVRAAFNGPAGYAGGVQKEAERAINQSLATPVSGGFAGLSQSGPSYGVSANSFIASNIGLFMNGFL